MIRNWTRIERFAFILLIATFTMAMYRLMGIGPSMCDDAWTALVKYNYGGVCNGALHQAKGQARFYQIFAYASAQLPFLWDNLWITNLFQVFTNLTVFAGFGFFLYKAFHSKIFSIIATTIVVALIERRYSCNPLNVLPMWFNFGFGCLFWSFYAYLKYLDQNKNIYKYLGIFLYVLGIHYYEVFLGYVILYPMLIIWRDKNFEINKEKIIELIKRPMVYYIITLLYVIAYVAYKKWSGSTYSGTEFSLGDSLSAIVETLFVMSHASLGFVTYQDTLYVIKNLSFTTFFTTISTFIIIFLGLYKFKFKITFKKFLGSLFLSFFLFILPNLPLAFTERYRNWVKVEPFYNTSYFSAFAYALILALIISYISSKVTNKKLRALYAVVVSLLLSYFTLHTNFNADGFYKPQHNARMNWTMLEHLAKNPSNGFFVPEMSVWAPTLLKNKDPYNYWAKYLTVKSQRKVLMFHELELAKKHNDKMMYWLFTKPTIEDVSYLALGKISDTENVDELTLFVWGDSSVEYQLLIYDNNNLYKKINLKGRSLKKMNNILINIRNLKVEINEI